MLASAFKFLRSLTRHSYPVFVETHGGRICGYRYVYMGIGFSVREDFKRQWEDGKMPGASARSIKSQ